MNASRPPSSGLLTCLKLAENELDTCIADASTGDMTHMYSMDKAWIISRKEQPQFDDQPKPKFF